MSKTKHHYTSKVKANIWFPR